MRALTTLMMMAFVVATLPLSPATGEDDIDPVVVISEVHPCPVDDPCEEYVELYVPWDNPGPVLLEDWTLTDNDGEPEIVLGHVTLEPGAHMVIWNRRPLGSSHLGLDCGKGVPTWNDEGDDVVLLDDLGDVRARLAYGSGDAVDPGPSGANGACHLRPSRGTSVCIDLATGTYVEAPPSPGAPYRTEEVPDVPAPEEGGSSPGEGRSDSHPPQPTAPGSLLLWSVHPGGAPDWEHVVLANRAGRSIDLSGWSLSDGEGAWEVVGDASIGAGARASVGLNATAFEVLCDGGLDLVVVPSGAFCLADDGDDLVLLDPLGNVVDALWYARGGEGPPDGWTGAAVPAPVRMPWGRVLARTYGEDTDTAADWTGWTEPRCGWMDPPPPAGPFTGQVAVFATPDEGWDHLARAIASAEETLDVAVYDMASADLAALIADRARAGVATRVLVEASPVGATRQRLEWRDSLLNAVRTAGASVHVTYATDPGRDHQPYRYHHEKYIVADARTVVVTTENLMPSSFPPPGSKAGGGCRGWGAVVRCKGLASSLVSVLEHDLRVSARAWEPDKGVANVDLPVPQCPTEAPPMSTSKDLRLLVGPEGWGSDLSALVEVLEGATSSIDLMLSDLEVRWGDLVSPLVEALLGVASRGVDVRLLLEPGPDGEGLDDLEELLWLASTRGALRLRGALASGIPNVTRVHAKGAVVDGRTALLGSMNWVRGSVARNREVDLVVSSEEAVRELGRTFEEDWEVATTVAGPRIPVRLLMEGLLPKVVPDDDVTLPRLPPADDQHTSGGGRSAGEPAWYPAARLLSMVAATAAWWWLNRRYGLTSRASLWLDRREEGARRMVEWLRGRARDAGGTTTSKVEPEMVVIVRSSRTSRQPPTGPEGPGGDGS